MKFFLSILMASVLLTSCASKLGKVLKSKDNEYKLKMAEQYYAQKKYVEAQQVFEDIMPYFRGSDKYEDMFYKYAYCAYNEKDYLNAESLFKTYTENFPNSTRLEECEYMRCFCYYKQSPKVELDQTATSKTISLMQAFINTHPQSARIKDATEIMDLCRAKLELKEYRAAELYYNLGQFRAAAIAFGVLINNYPESQKGDEYKLKAVRSYYRFAKLSVPEKQVERYERVVTEFEDFVDRYPDSKLLKDAESYKNLSLNHIKDLKNEQTQTSAKR